MLDGRTLALNKSVTAVVSKAAKLFHLIFKHSYDTKNQEANMELMLGQIVVAFSK